MKKIIFCSLLVSLLLCACGDSSQRKLNLSEKIPELIDPVGIKADTVEVMRRDISNEVVYVSSIVPEIIELSFEGSGNIGEMHVDVGQKVKKGKLLATLDGISDEDAIKEKETALSEAKSNFKLENEMAEADISALNVTLNEVEKMYKKEKKKNIKEQYKGQITTAQYEIKLAKKRLEQKKELQSLQLEKLEKELKTVIKTIGSTKLYSPMDGEVVGIAGGAGHMVQGGNTVIRVAKMNSPRIKAPLVAPDLLEKSSSIVAVVNGKEYKVKAERQEISAYMMETGEGMPQTTYFDFLDKNIKCKIGDFAMIHLRKNTSKNALSVPVNAVMKNDEGLYIYVQESGAKTKRMVTTGTKTLAYIEVLTGVKEGDIVYVES